MTNWQNLPNELQLRDEDILSLKFKDVERLFTIADEHNVVEQFASLFWPAMARVRNNPANVSLQRCVELLEERKRSLGRLYDTYRCFPDTKTFYAIRYNECEYNIRWLVEQYGVVRKSEPHLLEVTLDEI